MLPNSSWNSTDDGSTVVGSIDSLNVKIGSTLGDRPVAFVPGHTDIAAGAVASAEALSVRASMSGVSLNPIGVHGLR